MVLMHWPLPSCLHLLYSPLHLLLLKQSLLWGDGTGPSVAGALQDSSLGAFALSRSTSVVVNQSLSVWTSTFGCNTNTWATAAISALTAAGTLDPAQFTFWWVWVGGLLVPAACIYTLTADFLGRQQPPYQVRIVCWVDCRARVCVRVCAHRLFVLPTSAGGGSCSNFESRPQTSACTAGPCSGFIRSSKPSAWVRVLARLLGAQVPWYGALPDTTAHAPLQCCFVLFATPPLGVHCR